MIPTDKNAWELRIKTAYRELDAARVVGDALRIELLENALNDLLEQYQERSRCNT